MTMRALVIVEGTDLVGKSSTVEAIKEKLRHDENIFTAYMGKLPQEGNEPAIKLWLEKLKRAFSGYDYTNESIVFCDRSFIGNLVYGEWFGDQKKLSYEEVLQLFKFLSRQFETISVNLLTCSSDEFVRRFEQRDEDYVKASELVPIQEEYIKIFNNLEADLFPSNVKTLCHGNDQKMEYIIDNILTQINYEGSNNG
jgi:thymidylate kinase